MNIGDFKCLFNGVSKISLAKFKNVVVVKVSERLESACLGSTERLKSMMLINGYSHLKEFHAGENGSNSCQGQFFSEDSLRCLAWEISRHK